MDDVTSEVRTLSTEKAEIKVDFYGLKLVIVASVYAILSILAMIALCLCIIKIGENVRQLSNMYRYTWR